MKSLKRMYYMSGTAFTMGMLFMPNMAHAEGGGSGASFNTMAETIATNTEKLPGLIAALSYLAGTLLGVLGVMKVKDHVENPSQTPLKEGAIRLLAGGALFSLPIILEAMAGTIGEGGSAPDVAALKKASFSVED